MEKETSIWYNREGRIVAWGHLNPKAPVTLNAIPLAESGHEILTLKISEQHLGDLHETHYVDTNARQLAKKSAE
jgi:hypothetical protein